MEENLSIPDAVWPSIARNNMGPDTCVGVDRAAPTQDTSSSLRTFATGATRDTDEEKRYGHPEFYRLLDQMAVLHSRKNHDYAGTSDPLKNLRAGERIGIDPFTGVMVRLQDKWSRLESFMTSDKLLVKDESVEDTLMDNAVYSLLAIILRREAANETRANTADNNDPA